MKLGEHMRFAIGDGDQCNALFGDTKIINGRKAQQIRALAIRWLRCFHQAFPVAVGQRPAYGSVLHEGAGLSLMLELYWERVMKA